MENFEVATSFTLIQRQPLADAREKLKLRGVRSFGVSVFFPLNRFAAGCSLLHHQGLVGCLYLLFLEGRKEHNSSRTPVNNFWLGSSFFLAKRQYIGFLRFKETLTHFLWKCAELTPF